MYSGKSMTWLKERQPRLPLLIWSAAACCRFSVRFGVATQAILSPSLAQKKAELRSVLCKLLSLLDATLPDHLACVANKGLTQYVNPLDATLTKIGGGG
jgi:hypothetical protein